jgi:hypothetical protein
MSLEVLAIPGAEPLVHLVARNPVEMQDARDKLISWLMAKTENVAVEIQDYRDALEQAVKNKWSKRGLQKAVDNAMFREEFYSKALSAVKAGFTIVPDFPIDVFAIRTERVYAQEGVQTSRYGKPTPNQEQAEILPEGEGEYRSPTPKTTHWTETRKDNKGEEYKLNLVRPGELQAVVFPIRAARVEVMSATAEAMALRVFDEIGICPQTRKADPLIIGRICLPHSDKAVNFLIAWHLNLNEL